MPTNQDEYPLTVALSVCELGAVIKYHMAESKRISRAFGKAAMQMSSLTVMPSGRNLKLLHDLAKEELNRHTMRAKGLISLLPTLKK